nr:MAG TPA: hypothetical protein [Caudoviricetes sp.]
MSKSNIQPGVQPVGIQFGFEARETNFESNLIRLISLSINSCCRALQIAFCDLGVIVTYIRDSSPGTPLSIKFWNRLR